VETEARLRCGRDVAISAFTTRLAPPRGHGNDAMQHFCPGRAGFGRGGGCNTGVV
jgi:hypothetical protein